MVNDLASLISSVLSHPSSRGKNADELGKYLANILESHDFLNKDN